MKQVWCFSKSICVFILFLVGILLVPPLISRGTGLYLQSKCQEAFYSHFEADRAYWRGGAFCIENLHCTPAGGLDEGGFECVCPSVELQFGFSMWTGELSVTLLLDKPAVHLGSSPDKLKLALQPQVAEHSNFPFHVLVVVKEGLLTLPGERGLPFSLNLSLKKQLQGNVDVHFHHANEKKGLLKVELSESRPSALDLSFVDADMGRAQRFMQYFASKPLELSIGSGLATGALRIDLEENSAVSVQGAFVATDLKVGSRQQAVELSLPSVKVQCGAAPLAFVAVEEQSDGLLKLGEEQLKASFAKAEVLFNANGSISFDCTGKWDLPQQEMVADLSFMGEMCALPGTSKAQINFDKINGSIYFQQGKIPLIIRKAAIHQLDWETKACEFELMADYAGAPLLALKGHSFLNDQQIEFDFHHNACNLLGVAPGLLELSLDQDLSLQHFALSLPFELGCKEPPLCPLIASGALDTLTKGSAFQTFLQDACGNFDLSVEYAKKQLRYYLNGSKCRFNGTPFEKCIVEGRKTGPVWAIDHCSLDDLSITADFSTTADKLMVDFLGIRCGNGLLAGIDGTYLIDEGKFVGKINMEADLNHLKGIGKGPGWEQFLTGYLRSSGNIAVQLSDGSSSYEWEASLTNTIDSPSIMGLACSDIGEFAVHWMSGKKIGFKNVSTEFHRKQKNHKSWSKNEQKATISFSEIAWNLETNQLRIDDLLFAMRPEQVDVVLSKLHYLFPYHVDVAGVQPLLNGKKQGVLEGRVQLKESARGPLLRLELAKGACVWHGSEYQINNFALERSPDDLHIVFNADVQGYPLWCLLHTQNTMSQGQLYLSEHFPKHSSLMRDPELVRVDWRKSAHGGIFVEKIEGRFSGIDVCCAADLLSASISDGAALVGKMSIDLPKANKWLKPEVQEALAKWGIKGEFRLDGKWNFRKEHALLNQNQVTFQGLLKGRNIECSGYRFASLDAQIDQDATSTVLTKGVLEDPAGQLTIDKLSLTSLAEGTWLAADKIAIKNLQPAFLCSNDVPPLSETPYIMQVEVQDLTGYLHEAESFTASGKLSFRNHSKKSFLHTLFVIPSEILHRIGLNLTILTPASGTLFFNVQDAKFILTRLKDVYSKGKFSRFYLDTRNFQSSIDFNGNLDLQVRMRQYNLLFKLAELFTVNVSGTLSHPLYSLKKKS